MISWKKNLYAIWLAELFAIAGFNASMPIIPFYLQDMGVTDANELNFWVGIIQSVSAIALGLVAPVWGRLADSYGRRPMLLRAMFGGSIVIALMGFATTPWQLLALRTFQGLLTGTVGAATVLVAATVPIEETGFGMGLLQTAIFVGGSVGPMIGGFVSDLTSHRATFYVTSLLLAAGGLIVARFVHEEFTPQKAVGSFLRRIVPDFSPVLHSAPLLALLGISFAIQMANGVVNPILPLFVQQITSNPSLVASETGMVLGFGALSAALAAAIIGRFSFRLGYKRTLTIALAGAFLLTVPQAFSHTTVELLVFRLFGGFFLGGALPSVNALIARNTSASNQGSVYGINTSVSSGGMAVGPALGAVAAVAWGYPSTFLLTAAILLITTLALAIVPRARARARRTASPARRVSGSERERDGNDIGV
ncbi:MAG TPA: MFS transporter [Spirochaetia bacterium]|nr:MFS transporter [Spirochaetia bacterium]